MLADLCKKGTVGDFTGFVCDEATFSSENLIYYIYIILYYILYLPEHNVTLNSSDSAVYPRWGN